MSEAIDAKKAGHFQNRGTNPEYNDAELYYEDQFWAKLEPNGPIINVNTYEGNVWNVKVNGKTVRTWVIGKEKEYTFTI